MIITLTIVIAVLAVSPTTASVICVKAGAIATARWTNAADENCTWTGIVGSNFGIVSGNKGKYVYYLLKTEMLSLTDHGCVME